MHELILDQRPRRGAPVWLLAGVVFGAFVAAAAAPAAAAAQTISGRALDSAGTPIAHVRVLAHPLGDSAETSTRITFTNASGNFMLTLAERRAYVVRVRRIGFAAERDTLIDLTNMPDATLPMTLRGLAVALAPVRVAGRAPKTRCVTLDDTTQNPRVREWIDQALFALQTRRVVERDFSYKVSIAQTRVPYRQDSNNSAYSYNHLPGALSNQWMEDDGANLASILREIARGQGGDFMPTETTLLSPTFRTSYCVENTFTPNPDGSWRLQVHELSTPAGQPVISGSLQFTPDGTTIDAADFHADNGGTIVSIAHLAFTRISIDGESFPIISARGIQHPPGKTSRVESSVAQSFTYSAFTRQQR